MKKQWIIVGVLLLVVAAILVYQIDNQQHKESDNVVKIGAILPLTGKYADLGNWAKSGIMLAADEINKSTNNIKFDIIVEDAKSEPRDALNAYNKLININKVNIILTTSSALSLAIKPRALSDSILFFSIASHPEITADNNNKIFRPCNTSIEEGNCIVDFIKSENIETYKKTWIIYHNSEFGHSFDSQISQKIGNLIIGHSPYDDKPETFKTIATKAIQGKPDVIICIGFTPSLGFMIKTLRESNFKGEIISNIGFSTPSVILAAGETAPGTNYVDYQFPVNSSHFIKLDSLSKSQFNTGFASISYLSYFTIKTINLALMQNNNINQIAPFILRSNHLSIDSMELYPQKNGDILPTLIIKKYKL